MRVLRTIPTPWAPYSVMFSRDGTRLAVGGGSWYGKGGILLVNLASGESKLFPCADLPSPGRHQGPFTVSGVCFSPHDRHLAASTWASGQHTGPTLLLEVSGLGLTHREMLASPRQQEFRRPTPTGVLLTGNLVLTRQHRAQVEGVITIAHWPPRINSDEGVAPHHLTSSRIILGRGSAITGCGGLIPWQELEADPGWRESGRPADGLVVLPLPPGEQQVQVVPAQDCRRITAIGAGPHGDEFLTGGLDGELDLWVWSGRWRQRRLRAVTNHEAVHDPSLDITWATYNPNSIVGICYLAEGDRWASVSAAGEVCLWRGATFGSTWQLPEPGSPRSLAAHPDRPWIAVGVKKGGFGRPQSAVVIAEVAPHRLDPAWRTPTVLALAKAADEERICQEGALDPVRLAVLADALEEAGCADEDTLVHLRNHDPHLGCCWVIDRLTGPS